MKRKARRASPRFECSTCGHLDDRLTQCPACGSHAGWRSYQMCIHPGCVSTARHPIGVPELCVDHFALCGAPGCEQVARHPTEKHTSNPPCDPTHCYHHWIRQNSKERWNVKITKNWKRNKDRCAAMRCTNPRAATVIGECFDEDEPVPLCSKHLDKATTELKLWEVPGAVTRLDGEAVEMSSPGAAPPSENGELRAELEAESATASEALVLLSDFEIATQDDLEFVADALKDVKGNLKRLEARRKEITGPINAALKSVRELFKPPISALKESEGVLKRLIADAKNREAKENAAAVDAAASALDDGVMDEVSEALSQVRHTSNVDSVSTREVWAFEITDPDKVPRELCEVSEKLIRQFVKDCATHEVDPECEGVRFFRDTRVIARSK